MKSLLHLDLPELVSLKIEVYDRRGVGVLNVEDEQLYLSRGEREESRATRSEVCREVHGWNPGKDFIGSKRGNIVNKEFNADWTSESLLH